MDLPEIKKKILTLAIERGIVGFNFSRPITFRSGIRSPIYCDWRKAQAHPDLMELIQNAFVTIINEAQIENSDIVIAGVATGGIPHATLIAQYLECPSCYVRPDAKTKNYGLGNNIEGAQVEGKTVFLIEDLVSTAGSVVSNAAILMNAKAKNVLPVCIFTYGFERSEKELSESHLTLTSVLTASDLLPLVKEELQKVGKYDLVEDFIRDPEDWFDRHKTGFEFGYLTTLRTSAKEAGNIGCMGWDLISDALPEEFSKAGIRGLLHFSEEYFGILKSRGLKPGAFKPNEGFYTSLDIPTKQDFSGSAILAEIIDLFKQMFPGIPIILDSKRGDIGASSENYAKAIFSWNVEATTISGYMGSDSVSPFSAYCNNDTKKGVYALARTSNPGAKDIQSIATASGEPVYGAMGKKIIEWAKDRPGLGAVVGATSLKELEILAKEFAGKNIPLLIPGVGKQGGKGSEVIVVLKDVGIELDLVRINSSSALTHPWYSKENPQPGSADWREVCLKAYEDFMKEIAY